MAKKRSQLHELKAFGAKLLNLRGKGRSRERIARRLRNSGIQFDESTLVQYEKGTVWAPDPVVLKGLADIYEIPVAGLISLLLLNRIEAKYEAADADRLYLEALRQNDIDREGERLITANFESGTEAGRRAHGQILDSTIDLVRHSPDQRSGSLQGGPDALPAASSATRRLESLRERNRTLAGEVRNAIRSLTSVAERLVDEVGAAPAPPPKRTRRHRATS